MKSKFRLILIIIGILIVVFGCNKMVSKFDPKDNFKGYNIIQGKLNYINQFAGNGIKQPITGKKVYLAYNPSDGIHFLYTSVTDDKGSFIFQNLYPDKKYDVYFSDSINNILYTALLTVYAPTDNLELTAANDESTQTGLFVSVVDENNNPFPKADICLFNNQQLYFADTCVGNIDSKQTDVNGRNIFYNLPMGDYFLRIRATVDNVYLNGDVTINNYVPKGITPVNAVLKPSSAARDGVEVLTVDSNNHVLPFVPVCLFNNQTLFLADTTCQGSIANLTTGSNGKISFNHLPSGMYYFFAKVYFNNKKYVGTGSIQITGINAQSYTIMLK